MECENTKRKNASMLFERTALSKKPEVLIQKELALLKSEGAVTPNLVFRDPYVLNFLGLNDSFSESDLETKHAYKIDKYPREEIGKCNPVIQLSGFLPLAPTSDKSKAASAYSFVLRKLLNSPVFVIFFNMMSEIFAVKFQLENDV